MTIRFVFLRGKQKKKQLKNTNELIALRALNLYYHTTPFRPLSDRGLYLWQHQFKATAHHGLTCVHCHSALTLFINLTVIARQIIYLTRWIVLQLPSNIAHLNCLMCVILRYNPVSFYVRIPRHRV